MCTFVSINVSSSHDKMSIHVCIYIYIEKGREERAWEWERKRMRARMSGGDTQLNIEHHGTIICCSSCSSSDSSSSSNDSSNSSSDSSSSSINTFCVTCQHSILNVRGRKYSGCWCPVSLRRQGIRTHCIDYVESVSYCLIWGSISTTRVKSVWRTDINCRHIFVLLWKF